MTVFYGGRDLLDITGAVTAPRSRRLPRRFARVVQTLVGIGFAALVLGALVALP